MGFQPGTGIADISPVPSGEQANQLLTGSFTAVGTSLPINPMGPFNLLIYAQTTDTLNVTAGSANFTVATGTGDAAGTAINSTLVPPGTTAATFSGTSGTLAFPQRQLLGNVATSTNLVTGIADTSWLGSAKVSGAGIASGTTCTVVTASIPPNNNQPGTPGVIQLSTTPTVTATEYITFQIVAAGGVPASGSDTAATFTGYGITYSGTVQLERSFDNAKTWLLCGIGGQGAPAQFAAGTPISVICGEVERGVLYRLNCASYASGTIQYRISLTGQAALSLSIPVGI